MQRFRGDRPAQQGCTMVKRKKPGKQLARTAQGQSTPAATAQLLEDLRSLIRHTREGVA
jgi:hypothetical protein